MGNHDLRLYTDRERDKSMEYVITADNIRCGGCVSTIQDALGSLDGVQAVAVDIESGRVTITAEEGLRDLLAAALEASGYPEK